MAGIDTRNSHPNHHHGGYFPLHPSTSCSTTRNSSCRDRHARGTCYRRCSRTTHAGERTRRIAVGWVVVAVVGWEVCGDLEDGYDDHYGLMHGWHCAGCKPKSPSRGIRDRRALSRRSRWDSATPNPSSKTAYTSSRDSLWGSSVVRCPR
jgi:hypothetical protein